MNKNVRYVIYFAVVAVCFVSVILAIYDAVFLQEEDDGAYIIPSTGNQVDGGQVEEPLDDTMEVRVANFNTLFTNQINMGNYDTSNIQKIDPAQEIVYTAAALDDEKELYDVNIQIPLINIKGEVAQAFNTNTQEIFANKANEVMQSATVNTIYDVDYVAFVNGDILSVVIKSNLKEGDNPQRVIVQTYNYNLKTGKEVSAEELLTSLQYAIGSVDEEIKSQIVQASKDAEALQQSGYEVYTRNPEDAMYQVKNAKTYFLGENGAFYMIYAYGNQNLTSEIDIILFE